ncbi:MAG: ribokinase [Synechococcales cyanobacterium RU_4_20]|nr:ribokinase [Synechococcales cyanobacterium RU_4_20]NJR68051.1 ribokinase [Synechococcales cyanobacterium CRU_2_2]
MSMCIFGSLNMDLVIRTLQLPLPGETVQGREFETIPGGKGANQAIAVQRLGHSAHMVGRVGDDPHGQELVAHLAREGVEVSGISASPLIPTGVAMVIVDEASGDNQIVVFAGANSLVGAGDLDQLRTGLAGVDMLLLQMEIPMPAVVAAARLAKEMGVKVILDPAPAPVALPDELYGLVDILTPNQTEASRLAGFNINTPTGAQRAAEKLQRLGAGAVVVTLGEAGACCATGDGVLQIPPFSVLGIDATGAGDAFNAALAVGLAEGNSLYESLIWGSASGALTVTKAGAQNGLPTRGELEEFMSTHVADDTASH